MIKMEVIGLKELQERFHEASDKFQKAAKVTMQASLDVLTESVPPYPTRYYSTGYKRTGTLGKTLGSSRLGGAKGKPEVYKVKEELSGFVSGEWGTNLDYAPFVIGEKEQAWMHRGVWWTVKTVARIAESKIRRLWEIFAEEIAEYLEGR